MIQRLHEQRVKFAHRDQRHSPYVTYAGLLPFDTPLARPLRRVCVSEMSEEEELRYPCLPWWSAGAGRLYPLEKIYYFHTLCGYKEDLRSVPSLIDALSV
ncbi:hypothetical protein AAVH_10307 [Aphelenchoides avenae]|nr:hypothetical protein AAVH_38857 [Aphelenchus avenae]KAH7722225.1 hypothetical protein AAVH_10307 [Aphelenchus avenae]